MNPDLNGCKIFVRRSEMRGTRRHLQRFHEDPGELQRLIPPLLQMRLVADRRNSLTEGNVEFRIGQDHSHCAGWRATNLAPGTFFHRGSQLPA